MKIYYDKDARRRHIQDKKIGIIGYGIQGRAAALNLRDSGLHVLIANRKDSYKHRALKDGFKVFDIAHVVKNSDVLFFLIPDQAQKFVFDRYVKKNLQAHAMIVFAHGYSLYYDLIQYPPQSDIVLLAPRMPGKQIRDAYVRHHGIPAFVDVIQDATGNALNIILALAQAIGFTKAGVMEVSYKIETELDLFIEQFLIPHIIKSIHVAFESLVHDYDYPVVPTLLELYASGELAHVLWMACIKGIAHSFQSNASPTCQYGIASRYSEVLSQDPHLFIKSVIQDIRDGTFKKGLDHEARLSYPSVNKLWKKMQSKKLLKAHEWIHKNVR